MHRTQSYNEHSARYSELPEVYYVPSKERMAQALQSKKNKQMSADGLDEYVGVVFRDDLADHCKESYERYKAAIEKGVSREIARLMLPLNWYSKMRVCVNLWNWLGFLRKRCALHAQYEIRVYADAIRGKLKEIFPRTMALWTEDFNRKTA